MCFLHCHTICLAKVDLTSKTVCLCASKKRDQPSVENTLEKAAVAFFNLKLPHVLGSMVNLPSKKKSSN